MGNGESVGEMPATGDTAISMFDADSGLFRKESSDGFTVSGTEEDPIIEGGDTNISVSEGTADAPGDTDILTGTGLSLTFEDDIAPLSYSEEASIVDGEDSYGEDGEDAFGEDGEDVFGEDGEDVFGEDGEDVFGEDGEDVFGEDGEDVFGEDGEDVFGEDGEDVFGEDGEDAGRRDGRRPAW